MYKRQSFKIHPAHASILNGRTTPKIGGSTQFICMRNIYNKLDQSIQKQLDNLDAIHHFAHSRSKIDPTMVSQIELDKFPPVVHPMVKINPINHKKAVYFGSHTKSIKNLSDVESSNLLKYLNDFINNEEYIYSHQWDDNDLIVWDNRSMVHRGQPYDITEPRYLVRATVSDTMSTGTYIS